MENLKNIQPIDNFDWDALEKGESYGSVSKEDLVKTYDETLNTVKDKEVVMGTVTAMNKREVVVNIGFKSDGVVPMSEFRYNPDLKIGDTKKLVLLVLGNVLTKHWKMMKSSRVTSSVVRRAV